jgi:hypothetical protein
MKHKRIIKLVARIVAGLVMTGGSVSHAQPPVPAKNLAVSKYGTLLEIFDAKGKSRFGKLTGHGFQLSYEFQGKTKTVSAVGNAKAMGLVAGEVKTDGKSTIVTNTTSDRALEITTYFFVNKKTNRLSIQRKFRNISKKPVVVKSMLEYVDPALVAGAGQNLKETGKELVGELRNAVSAAMVTGDCQPECPDDPPPCPIQCPNKIKFDLSRMTIRTNPVIDRPASLILPADAAALTMEPAGNTNNQVLTHLFVEIPAVEIG